MKRRSLLVIALAAACLGGCFRTVVRSGHPPAEAPEAYDQRWHSGFAAGLIETSGPHPLDQVCPEGWAEVRTETDPLHSFVTLVTTFVYSPQGVTVVCAEPGAPPAAPASGYDVPALPAPSARGSSYPPPPPPAPDF